MVRQGRLKCFRHLECKENWVLRGLLQHLHVHCIRYGYIWNSGYSICSNLKVVAMKCRGRKTWREYVKRDMDFLGLKQKWA